MGAVGVPVDTLNYRHCQKKVLFVHGCLEILL